MRKTLLTLALVGLFVLPIAYAQVFDADKIVPANHGEDLDDTTVAIVIKYVGPAASATIDVNSGNLELFSGAEGAEAVDTDAADGGCDVEDRADLAHAACGVATGIDLAANAACDTVGELVDIINSTRYWRAQIVAALRADALGTAGTNLIDPADADAKEVNGTTLLVDNSDVGYVTIAMTPFTYKGQYKYAGNWFTNDSGYGGDTAGNATLLDPFAGYISVVTGFAYIYGDGDTDGGKMRFYEVDMDANTETLVYEYDLGADDTWAYVTPATLGGPLSFAAGQKLLVRMYTAGTMDADNDILLHGFMYKTDLRR
jgi:hypothetical protein